MRPDTEKRMWGEFWLRWATKPVFSFKYWALGTPSMNTIAKRQLYADVCVTDDVEVMKRAINHQAMMFGVGRALGLRQ